MGYRNTELKTVSKVLTSSASAINIGGQVPAGMKRWVTFLAADALLATGAESVRVYIASVGVSNPTAASLIATSNRKMVIDIRASGPAGAQQLCANGPPFQLPARPDTNAPLFSIAASKWLGAFATRTTGNLFVQYYDE